jgi:hypothetical protein
MKVSIGGRTEITVEPMELFKPDELTVEFYYRRGTHYFFRGEGEKLEITTPELLPNKTLIKGHYYTIKIEYK